jgi:hypothetical protein
VNWPLLAAAARREICRRTRALSRNLVARWTPIARATLAAFTLSEVCTTVAEGVGAKSAPPALKKLTFFEPARPNLQDDPQTLSVRQHPPSAAGDFSDWQSDAL